MRRIAGIRGGILLICMLLLGACSPQKNTEDDIITQNKVQEGKIPITLSVKYSVYLDAFEQAAEEQFPNLDLIQVGNYTANYSEEYEQQLANNDLTDIIVTWPLDNAARNCEERLVDMSAMEFTSRYNISAFKGISQNGRLYYLPGPTQVRGILYNKTMFEENGWEVPNDFDEFIELCQKIEESGIRSLQLSFWNHEVLRNAFMGFGYTESFSSPQKVQALEAYNAGQGSIGDFAIPAFESFNRMIDAGIFRPEDLDVRYPQREQMLFKRQCAMVSDGLALIELAKKAGSTDEFAVMPFFCPGDKNTWGLLVPTQYIGINQELTKTENKEKYELVLQIMDFISTPEGQLALADNNASLISSLKDNKRVTVPELADIRETIDSNRYTIFPSLVNADEALYEGLAGILRGEMNTNEAIASIDERNRNPQPIKRAEFLGNATETFSLMETGNYVTDVLREYTGADIALFLDNGKDGKFNARGISAKIYQGDIRESDVTKRILPVLQHGEEGYLNIVTISGENLSNVLEYSLPDGKWFYYFSGLKMTYDPTEKPGHRLHSLTEENGKKIDPKKLYKVAVMEGCVDEQWMEECETTNTLVKDIIIEDIKEKETISPKKDGRFKIPDNSKEG